MEVQNWYDILYALTSIVAIYIFARLAYSEKSLAFVFFGLAIFSFITGVSLGYFDLDKQIAREWGDFVGITLVLCALFVKIRDSKPVFARFPIALTFLPLISIFFYPMVSEAEAVKNLLRITYQGGAILVGMLLVTINQLLHRKRMFLLIAGIIFLGAYITYWFIQEDVLEAGREIGSILFAIGMVFTAYGFKKSTITINTNE